MLTRSRDARARRPEISLGGGPVRMFRSGELQSESGSPSFGAFHNSTEVVDTSAITLGGQQLRVAKAWPFMEKKMYVETRVKA